MKTGLFTFTTHNIGDDMQMLAVLAHLSRVDTFLDRDRLASLAFDDDVACVFNSWFLIGDDLRRPSPRVRPLWHGFCAGRPEVAQGEWLEYLREQGPIGCRDLHTAEMLSQAGVSTTWTGCLTLFLGTALGLMPPAEREGILFVDVPAEAEAWIPSDIVDRATHVSTFPPPDSLTDPFGRLAAAARLLRRMASAELVVTRRLHAALPAASLGTPVVAIPDPRISNARQRFAGLDRIVPTVYLDSVHALRDIDWRHVPGVRVPEALRASYDRFRSSVAVHTGVPSDTPGAVLDLNGESCQLLNVDATVRPAELRMRLGERTFPLRVREWCTRHVDVWLAGFPGLAKFALEVEVQHHGQHSWTSWGRLSDLITASDHTTIRWRVGDLRDSESEPIAAV
jgi:hypothetical protein